MGSAVTRLDGTNLVSKRRIVGQPRGSAVALEQALLVEGHGQPHLIRPCLATFRKRLFCFWQIPP